MTTTSTIASSSDVLAGGTAATSSERNAYSALGSEQFLKLVLTQLSNQDPLQPNDSNALLQQLSNIRNIQSSVDMQDKLKSLVGQNELSSAATLIGRTVVGLNSSNQRVEGRVASISKTTDGAVLRLSTGQSLSMSRLEQVREAAAAATTATQGAAS